MNQNNVIIPSLYQRRSDRLGQKKLVHLNFSKNKEKKHNFLLIGTNGDEVCSGSGSNCMSVETFFESLDSSVPLLVSTVREWELLLPFICMYGSKIQVLEKDFPVFDDIRYSKSALTNLKQLKSKSSLLRRYGILGKTLASSLLPKLKRKFFRKVTKKTNFDLLFAFADHSPLREVFNLAEERSGRCVVALDVNSMYLHCMTGKFGDPQSLRRLESTDNLDCGALPRGLYRVAISQPKNDFIRHYHPFTLNADLYKLPFKFSDTDKIDTYLSSDEIKYYSKHFHSIDILEGFVFEQELFHPLLRDGIRLFNKKNKVESGVRKNILKSSLNYMHTVSSRRKYKNIKCACFDELKAILHSHLNIPSDISDINDAIQLSKRAGSLFYIDILENGYNLVLRDFNGRSIVNSFSYEVIARSRIYMLELLEKLLEFDGLDVCYINVDSFHVSISVEKKEAFYKHFSEILSPSELGKLKVEAVSERGYWIELGQYYLLTADEMDKYKVGKMKSPGNKAAVQSRRVLKGIMSDLGINYIVNRNMKIQNSFTYKKKTIIEEQEVKQLRFDSQQIANVSQREYLISQEIVVSKPLKLRLLKKIIDTSADI